MKAYNLIEKAKNGYDIPFIDGTPIHSKYDPVKEAGAFVQNIEYSPFFIVCGLGGGYHIKSLQTKYPDSTILIIENDEKDIEYLKQITQVQELCSNPKIIITTTDSYCITLKNIFSPLKYDSYCFLVLRSWSNAFKNKYELIRKYTEQTLNDIASDYKTQAFFGKIWHHNIMQNLKIASKTRPILSNIDTTKTAAIIGAGPSLDITISFIEENRKGFYIISTDTAFSSLIKKGITPDAVISIDGQDVSKVHFMHKLSKDTLYVMDLSANVSVCNYLYSNKYNLLYTHSGHPLCSYAASFTGIKHTFAQLDTGSGTVTIAAASFAIKAGFTKLRFFGADFSYKNGKAYAQGTYFDSLFSKKQSHLNSLETMFDKILFRSKLTKIDDKIYTTDLLTSYRISFERFITDKGFTKNGEIYTNYENENKIVPYSFDYEAFITNYENELKHTTEKNFFSSNAGITLLPLKIYEKEHKLK